MTILQNSSDINTLKRINFQIFNLLSSDPPAFSEITTLATQQILHRLCPDGIITSSACAEIMKFTEKEERVKSKCDLSKIKVRPDDGRPYIIIQRKTISSTSYTGLIDKLYDLYFGINTVTLQDFFEVWMQWRKDESSVSAKTVKENRFLWNRLLRDSELSKRVLRELTVQDYISFFRVLTKTRSLTRKCFNDLKSILNGMMYLAVERGILEHNCLRDINYKQFAYKAENTEITPYTEAERTAIIYHLQSRTDRYSLAILLDFHLVLRIGELKGLKWSDISGDTIRICRFINDKNEVVEDIKGHTSQGIRSMPLTPTAKIILARIQEFCPSDSDFIFTEKGQPLTTVTFNRHLKACCEELGIEYRSSHKLRFSTASIMYKNGVEDTELQKLLGHTSLTMTRHYLRNVTSDEETANKMSIILG